MKISDEQFARLKDVLLKSDITDNTIDKLIDSVNNEEIDDELLDYYVTPKVTKHDKVIALKDRIFNHGNRITSMPKNVIERLRKNENKLSVFEKLIKRKKKKIIIKLFLMKKILKI